MENLVNIFLALQAPVAMLFVSRQLMHYFQLESYQFQGYFRTLWRQKKKVIVPLLLLTAVHIAAYLVSTYFIYQTHDIRTENPEIKRILYAGISFLLVAAMGFLLRRQAKSAPAKKPFVVTSRVKRLYAVHLIVVVGIGLLIGFAQMNLPLLLLYFFYPLLLPLVVALSAVLALPIEKMIFRMYFKDAEKKLLQNKWLIRIGITGSYGKTSTKFVLNTILSQKYNVLCTPASFNTPMGVTRIVRERLQPSHQVFIGEMGARHVGEIKELCNLVHPEIGILTAVGPQHLDTFRTIERIEKTKYELIEALPEDSYAVFLNDDGIVTRLYEKTEKPKCLVGREGSEVWAEDVQVSATGSSFMLCFKDGEKIPCETRLLGEHNILNILTAAAVAKYLKLTGDQIARGIAALQPVEHRLQLLKSAGGVTVIDDAFNTNPRSAKKALDVLKAFPGRRIIVTPGMVELGAEEEKYNEEFGSYMADCVDIAVLVGKKHTAPIVKGLQEKGFKAENIHVVSSLDEAIRLNQTMLRSGDVVMYENDLPDHYSEG
ncbi:MAG: UDP-N-acetylmuramoyl-tripeptide--D-alanyl-D-alanine ligase [Clostridia bacterium]|nr:UDP-N-acetylmuramoyl-tripeptide--D-alanyl-D-alanine ligase [Clostridia bacterium]